MNRNFSQNLLDLFIFSDFFFFVVLRPKFLCVTKSHQKIIDCNSYYLVTLLPISRKLQGLLLLLQQLEFLSQIMTGQLISHHGIKSHTQFWTMIKQRLAKYEIRVTSFIFLGGLKFDWLSISIWLFSLEIFLVSLIVQFFQGLNLPKNLVTLCIIEMNVLHLARFFNERLRKITLKVANVYLGKSSFFLIFWARR